MFDEARTSPHVPSSAVTRTPFTVVTSRIFCPMIGSPVSRIAWMRFVTFSITPYFTSSPQCGDIVGVPQVFGSAA